MSTAINMTSGAAGTIYTVLKEIYDGQKPAENYIKEWPLLSMMKSNEKLGGRGYPVPFIAGPAVNANATFSLSQLNSAPGKPGEFMITTSDIFGVGYIDAKTVAAAKNDKQTFVNALSFNMNGALEGATKNLALAMYRKSYGVLAQVSAITAGVATLTNASDCLNFEVGQCCRASTAATGASLKGTATSSSGYGTAIGIVLSVDRMAGTVTFSDAYASATAAATPGTDQSVAWAANDYVYQEGDATLKMSGLLDWIPSTAPSNGESFFGVDRFDYVRQRVAGTYYDGSKRPLVEAIGNACAYVKEAGGNPKTVFMTPVSLQGALNECQQKGTVDWGTVKGTDLDVSFEGLNIRYAGGKVTCVADPACPAATAFALDLDHWWLGSIGPSVSVFDLDGMPFLRVYNANQIELRVNSYSQIYTDKPNSHATIALQF